MKQQDPITAIILRTVDKIGGVEKMEACADALRIVAKSGDKGIGEFFARLAANPAGQKQFLANAIGGCALYAATYRSVMVKDKEVLK